MDAHLLARVEALELQLRRWKLVSLVVLAALGILLLTGAAYAPQGRDFLPDYGQRDGGLLQMPARNLVSHNFDLIGKDGRLYARLTASEGKPQLEFYDRNGRVIWSAPPEVGIKPVTPSFILPGTNQVKPQ